MNSLAADLADGVFDDRGGTVANPHESKIAQIINLQILFESMLQDLKVNGTSAEDKLNDTIATMTDISNKLSHSYRSSMIKQPMLRQARLTINALQKTDSSALLRDFFRKSWIGWGNRPKRTRSLPP